MLFRGIIYPTFKQVGFPKLGLWATSFIFAFLHNNGPSFVPFLVLALLLAVCVAIFGGFREYFGPIRLSVRSADRHFESSHVAASTPSS